MNDAHEKGEKIIYLSISTMCIWTQWTIDAFYHGLKKLGCKVIWSIRNQELLPKDMGSNFWVSAWVPQIEFLAHPAVAAGLCHCGFGGTLEFINSGIPMFCFPHFGD